ncbi:MAG: ATP-dependent sacrificial sulfur transferase LarE [Thermovenabulum sp.]|uniref:ATP-dependent sacrificial sulfur transferase LarE n=1 Tax=Thermovenabulum sp. TaxID=3100335 RepID=UPI003C7BED86
MEGKFKELENYIKNLKKVLVAFSGGVDSSFLLKVCIDTLGRENVLAVTVNMPAVPGRELEEAREIAKVLGANHLVINALMPSKEKIYENPPDRCYICKRDLFSELIEVGRTKGIFNVLDASNADDEKDYRPGLKALQELKIISPLRELKFTKEEIRFFSKKLGLTTAEKPSFACLFTRFPYGERITKEKLLMVEKAEDFLKDLGFTQYRVRMHNNLARIEVFDKDIEKFFDKELREKVVKIFKEIGFKYVSLDLEGYRMGSMN